MNNSQLISSNIVNSEYDLNTVLNFLSEHFGATRFSEKHPSNVILLGGRRWWVVTSAAQKEFELSLDSKREKTAVIKKLNEINAGLLIFRKFDTKYSYAVYLIENIEPLAKLASNFFTINWEEMYSKNVITERGIVIDNEIIGFKTLRRCRPNFHA